MKTISTTEKLLVLAADDYELNDRDLSSYSYAYLYTNACTINVASVKAKELHLHATEFYTSPDHVTFDTSGAPGKQPKTSSDKTSANGGDAHPVYFSASDVDLDANITFNASGGDAATGYSGIATQEVGGQGGNGGKGANANLIFNDRYRVLLRAASSIDAAKTDTQRQQALKQWLLLATVSVTGPEDLITQITDLSKNMSTMSKDQTSSDLGDILDSLDSLSQSFDGQFVTVDCTGGEYGTGGEGYPQGKNGAVGNSAAFHKASLVPKSIRSSSELIFHPEQVSMTLRDIENNYFVNTETSLRQATATAKLLIGNLSFLDQLTSEDPLYAAYNANELDIFVIPSGTSEPASITTMKRSLKQAKQYAVQLASGYDFYGHEKTWVPSGSLTYYTTLLGTVLGSFDTIEQNYLDYQAAAADYTKRADQLNMASVAATVSQSKGESDRTTLETTLRATASQIDTLQSNLPSKRKAVDNAIAEAADKIQNSFNVSMADFISAASQFAFAPGLPMGIIQGANLLDIAATQVTDDTGLKVQKAYIVNQIGVLQSGLDGLDQAVKESKSEPGISTDDPSATKLIGAESDIMDLVGKYRGLLGDDELKELKTLFDDYVNTIIQRNDLIIMYNACINLWFKAQSQIDAAMAIQASIGRSEAETLNAEIPEMSRMVEQSYFDTTNKVLEILYNTQRSLLFWSLDASPTSLSKIRQLGFPQKGLSSALKQAQTDLLSDLSHAVENFTSKAQPFGTAGGRSDPVKIELDSTHLEALCRPSTKNPGNSPTSSVILLTIPPAYPDTGRDENRFADYCDVRLTNVRFYLEGASTRDNELIIDLEHLGRETIVDTSGLAYTFTHSPIQLKFQYNVQTLHRTTDGDLEGPVKDQYALMGPFCQWRIEVSSKHNSGLDLSNVTRAWFEFSGWSRAFEG
jgi:hypothetical protein